MRFARVSSEGDDEQRGFTMLNGVYFHGKLSDALGGFDLVNIFEDDIIEYIHGEQEGIEGAEVTVDGFNGKAILYAWRPNSQYTLFHRGLIVDADDTESVEYAKEQFSNRSITL